MYTYELFSGEKSFIPAGAKPQHGDPDLVMNFDKPLGAEWNEKMWLCFDIRVAQFSDAKVFIRFYDANERMIEENAAKPAMKRIFSGWGGWQWLYQLRQCGSEGLVTERVAYAPLIMRIWRAYLKGEPYEGITEAFAMYRLCIDQRNFPGGGLRDYSLYFLEKEGLFRNRVSRRYADAKETEGGSFGSGKKWKLDTVDLPERQRRELDLLYGKIMQALPD